MFWRYNLITVSHIGTLLERENVTLKELMNEDDILQECKAQNKKLIDFLVQPHILEEMITMITKEPEESANEKIRYKYANIACELLTFDHIDPINDALVSQETLMNKLYSFLESAKPLNPLLASFFSKTMALLLSKRSEKLFEYLKSKKDFINLLLHHIDTSAIMDLLLKFLSCSVSDKDVRARILKWLCEKHIIERLVAMIDPAFDENTNCNAANALCDTIKANREYMSLLQDLADPEPLLDTIESVEVVSDLLEHMFCKEKEESVLVNGISVLLALLEFKKHGPTSSHQVSAAQNPGGDPGPLLEAPQVFASFFCRNDGPEQMTVLDIERLSKGVNNVITAVTPYLPKFHKLLLDPPPKPAITLTTGVLDPPFGICRREVAHLISAIIVANVHEANVRLCELKTVPTLLDLFFHYKWNNFLHTQVEHVISRIITNSATVDKNGKKVHPLLDQLLMEYKITLKILEIFEQKGQSNTNGYMGHVILIANHIVKGSENGINSALIIKVLKDFPNEHFKLWEEFVNEKLAEINQKNTAELVSGVSVSSISSTGVDVDFRNIQPLPQQMMHQMTSNFDDQFGFGDEFNEPDDSGQINRPVYVPYDENIVLQRNADIFEQLCREKRQAQLSEDADSDEDVWEDKEEKPFSYNKERKSSDENSSDEDDNIASNSNAGVNTNNDEMEIDNQEGWTANFDNVPMDVTPISIQNPWEGTEQPSSTSDEQENWADFRNFATFPSASIDCSNEISSTTVVAMDTSDSIPDVKFMSSSEVGSICDSTSGDDSHVPPGNSSSTEITATNASVECDKILPEFSAGVSSESEAKSSISSKAESQEKKNDVSAFKKEECLSSTAQNGPI